MFGMIYTGIKWIFGIVLLIVAVGYIASNPGVGTTAGHDIHGVITALFNLFHGATGQ